MRLVFRRRYIATAAALALGAAAGLMVYRHMFGTPNGSVLGVRAAARTITEDEHRRLISELWASLPVQNVRHEAQRTEASMDSVANYGEPLLAVNNLIDTCAALTSEQKKKLRECVGAEVWARSGRAEDYVEFAERDATTRWLAPSDNRAWELLDLWWDYRFHEAAPRISSRELLLKYLQDAYGSGKARWRAIASGSDGARVLCFDIRAKDELYVRLEQDLLSKSQGERDAWLRSNSANATAFRLPRQTLEQALSARGLARVVVLMIVVEDESGSRFNWSTIRYWDPSLHTWVTEATNRKGWGGGIWY